MEIVILVIHTLLAATLIGVVLLQPPEGNAMGGLGGGSNPMAGNAGRGQANFLTRVTAILATGFIITSLVLAVLSGHQSPRANVLDLDAEPAAAATQTPPIVAPKAPSVPVAQ